MSGHRLSIAFVLALMLGVPAAVFADTLTLKDGTVLEGTVIKQSEKYWVRTADGQTRNIPFADVKSLLKAGAAAPVGAGATGALPTGPAKPLVGNIATVQRRAEACDTPLMAVTLWQEFIDTGKPSTDDLKIANEEMTKWKSRAEGGAEKINGRWISGAEHEALVKKASGLIKEGMELLMKSETLKGEKKLEEARKIYPNDYRLNFWLGYLEMLKGTEKAGPYFDQVLRLKPRLPEAMGNLAVLAWKKGRYVEAIKQIHEAAKNGDTLFITLDLLVMVYNAPDKLRNSAEVKSAMEDSRLLASKYGIDASKARNAVPGPIPLSEEGSGRSPGDHGIATGSGFIISPEGLILTNAHVVKEGKTFMVMLDGGTQKAAEVVVIDDEQDLALVRLKNPGKALPTIKLAPTDKPADGAECTVIGYPLIDRLGGSPKITHGIVSSSRSGPASLKLARSSAEVDVTVDAKVNPGNSGGPILDKYGNVMAIVCMKSLASETEDSYGMGISAGRIRRFLAKNKVDVQKGEIGKVALSVEDVASKVEPSAVLILATR